MADTVIGEIVLGRRPRQRSSLHRAMRRKSTIAFWMPSVTTATSRTLSRSPVTPK